MKVLLPVGERREEIMKRRILCLALAVFMLAGCFVACDGSGDDVPDGGDKNGDWANLDFGGATLSVCVSKHQDEEVSFRPGDVYTKGPDDTATSESIAKKVLARNKKVATDLDINLKYTAVDLWYHEIAGHLEQLLTGDGSDAPDVYHNDIYALCQGMLNGYFWNVSDPGKDAKGRDVKSYFEFDNECWYQDYMEGATYDKNKMYLLAGNYNLDIIRYAWVYFVNTQLWDATFTDSIYGTYEEMCEYVHETKEWFYDDVIFLAGEALRDGTEGSKDVAEKTDNQIGCVMNGNMFSMSILSSGESLFKWTKNGKDSKPGEGTPSMIRQDEIDGLVAVGNKITQVYNAKGVLVKGMGANDHINTFMEGKTVLAQVQLGEMESERMRETMTGRRGVLPFPRYSDEVGIMTMVHDQAEVDCILNNASSFEMASAFLQYVNEQSRDILDTYYEDVLKFKYNNSRGVRKMIDIVYDTISSPFELVSWYILFGRVGGDVKGIWNYFEEDAEAGRDSTFSSTYESIRGPLQNTLTEVFNKFESLE